MEEEEEEDEPVAGYHESGDAELLFENSDRVLVDGRSVSKQEVLNELINKPIKAALGGDARDRLKRAIAASRPPPSSVLQPLEKDCLPMVGDPFMAVAAFKGEDALGTQFWT